MSSGVSTNQLLVPKIALAWLMTGLLALGCYRYFEWPMRVFLRRALALRGRPAVSVATPAQSFDPARSSSGRSTMAMAPLVASSEPTRHS
jgi:peptidoglycan/LPS O-acetylase OafA/YrhL